MKLSTEDGKIVCDNAMNTVEISSIVGNSKSDYTLRLPPDHFAILCEAIGEKLKRVPSDIDEEVGRIIAEGHGYGRHPTLGKSIASALRSARADERARCVKLVSNFENKHLTAN